MTAAFQLVIDCAEPDRLARFRAVALGYVLQPPSAGFASWDEYWRSRGWPEEDCGLGEDCVVDPDGHGPRIWFQVVPEPKTIKNRLHIDVPAGGERVPFEVRRKRVGAHARRLADLGATMVAVSSEQGTGRYAIAMRDPEGNEFDIY
jgi:hypothetical protein